MRFELKYAILVFLITFVAFVATIPHEVAQNLSDGKYHKLLPSDDVIPNTVLPFVLFKYKNLDFTPVLNSGLIHKGNPDAPHYFFLDFNDKTHSVYPLIPGYFAMPVYFFILALQKIPEITYHENIVKIIALGRVTASFYTAISVSLFYLLITALDAQKNALGDSSRKKRILFTLLYAFGTSTWSVSSRGLWLHTFVQLFNTLSLLMIVYGQRNQKFIKYAGFFLGLGVLTRVTNIFVALLLTLYAFINHRGQFAKFVFYAVPTVIYMFLFNYLYYGGILIDGYTARGYGPRDLQHWSTPLQVGVFGNIFSPARGLLFIAPILLFGLINTGLHRLNLQKSLKNLNMFLWISCICTILLMSKWFTWHGANAFGGRMLIDIYPLLGYLSYDLLRNVKSKVFYFACVACLGSVFFHFNGVVHEENRCHIEDNWNTRCIIPDFYREK